MEITPSELAEKARISAGYASMLLSGKRTSLSLSMALQIYDATGLQFGFLKNLKASEIATLRKAAA